MQRQPEITELAETRQGALRMRLVCFTMCAIKLPRLHCTYTAKYEYAKVHSHMTKASPRGVFGADHAHLTAYPKDI